MPSVSDSFRSAEYDIESHNSKWMKLPHNTLLEAAVAAIRKDIIQLYYIDMADTTATPIINILLVLLLINDIWRYCCICIVVLHVYWSVTFVLPPWLIWISQLERSQISLHKKKNFLKSRYIKIKNLANHSPILQLTWYD